MTAEELLERSSYVWDRYKNTQAEQKLIDAAFFDLEQRIVLLKDEVEQLRKKRRLLESRKEGFLAEYEELSKRYIPLISGAGFNLSPVSKQSLPGVRPGKVSA